MQLAARQCLWEDTRSGTVIELVMTAETGLSVTFEYTCHEGEDVSFSWGDGTRDRLAWGTGDRRASHTYPGYGRYVVTAWNIRSIGFRILDGRPQCVYDGAIVSLVDRSGRLVASRSGAFKRCANLKRFIAPACTWMGQRDLAYCTSLEEVEIGENQIYYDGTFEGCSALRKFTTRRSGTCWSYVWRGCSSLAELRLGQVAQFATQDFADTPNLKDIWIDGKTVDQILQRAATGNIVAGYGARFPWGACADCRFHGTDGTVLGNGTRI